MLKPTTQKHLSSLANFCRSGRFSDPIPGIHTNNVEHYRRLVYNVVDGVLRSAYPLTVNVLHTEEWKNLVLQFFTQYACQSPQVWYMPKEFYEYVAATQSDLLQLYPFLTELLYFEWTEIELFMMADKPLPDSPKTNSNIVTDTLVLNPEHQLLSFTYPIHTTPPNELSEQMPGNYFVIGYRNKDGKILFTDLDPIQVRLIEYIHSNIATTLSTLITSIEQEYNITLQNSKVDEITAFLGIAHKQEMIFCT